MNDELCADCGKNKWEIECPECSRHLCHECVRELDGFKRCQTCKEKDLERGERYSRAVYAILQNEDTAERFREEFLDMVENMFGGFEFDADNLLHYADNGQVLYLTDNDVSEMEEEILVPEINQLLDELGLEPLRLS